MCRLSRGAGFRGGCAAGAISIPRLFTPANALARRYFKLRVVIVLVGVLKLLLRGLLFGQPRKETG